MMTSPRDISGWPNASIVELGGAAGGQHDPDRARRLELRDEGAQRELDRLRALRRERRAGRGIAIVDDAGMAGAHEPAHDVGAHAPKTDHSELHREAPIKRGQRQSLARST